MIRAWAWLSSWRLVRVPEAIYVPPLMDGLNEFELEQLRRHIGRLPSHLLIPAPPPPQFERRGVPLWVCVLVGLLYIAAAAPFVWFFVFGPGAPGHGCGGLC